MELTDNELIIVQNWLYKFVTSSYYNLTPEERALYIKLTGSSWDYIHKE